ncbi:hypothetical protein [Actinocorallia longicatena]|uniref:Uncharacterized protein n=1 Tax=Actinocorallia longicatena TaxID=111803 RepID=A0ABP6QKJ7_9ACTN
MQRIATIVLTTGSLILGTGAFATAAQAKVEPPAPSERPAAAVPSKPKGSFTTKKGFKYVEAGGSYSVTADKITVKFKVKDKKRDGWTPGVQFAAIEAWDIDDSGVHFVTAKARGNGRGTTPGPGGSGTIEGPPINKDINNNQGYKQKCYTCKVKRYKPKKKVYKNPLADGKYTYKFKASWKSAYTEGLFVREILIKKKKGKKGYTVKKGALNFVYFAPLGKLVGFDNPNVRVPGTQKAAKLSAAERAGIARAKDAPLKAYSYSTATTPGQPSGVTAWGIVTGAKENDFIRPLVVVRIRDDKTDKRIAAVKILYTNDDPNDGEVWTLWKTKDKGGQFVSFLSTSNFRKHMYFQSCVGRNGTNDQGQPTFIATNCGEVLRGY